MITSPAIAATQVSRDYQVPGRKDVTLSALRNVSLEVASGSFTAIVGASGSGKSTLLHWLAGLDQPTSGQISALGNQITTMTAAKRAEVRSRHVGFVFQDYNLIDSLNVVDNICMPARLAGRTLSRSAARQALEAVGLQHRATLKPHQLSGGEQLPRLPRPQSCQRKLPLLASVRSR